ncbi:hypothetical protein H257_07480 [Aphanomyces astaci]|uniref:Uncharacterized protein n=1 Tax=Aphanomyces astaci TaxID=112090 RepID=W4GKP9_APHAT|nr:hypothetical protein H257_07480 [Aphanomyces astaci]ETV79483.1 hypothetical protein H257_07480 [Aphanomyces astaci]|eukprot:XP_009831324.1 hypothetical protein H257_07480 [Aphanomyces astaci]
MELQDPARPRTFAWQDGSSRRSPEHWKVPNLNCRSIWLCWFMDDSDLGICPFRFLTPVDVTNWRCLAKYRHVLTTLVQIAIDRQLAPSEAAIATLSRPQLKALFVPSFRVLKLGVPMEVMSEMDTNSIAAVHKVLTSTDALHP